jgi:protein-L-isoaspartate(D-aspartate) O-methyltransferase
VIDLETRRRFYAEEVAMVANLRSPALVEALATVPREQFVPPGPWTVRGETDFGGPARQTPDDDPKHVYHNIVVAIDPARQLFNGAPSLLGSAIDALGLEAGHRALHIGTGMGYYTALIAQCVGQSGMVLGIEVDPALAAATSHNLASMPWAHAAEGDGRGPFPEPFDAILVNAGVTHPLDAWLDALKPGGRIIMPITATSPQMGPISKGFMVLATRQAEGDLTVRTVGFVAIYAAIGIRDDAMNAALGRAMMKGPFMPAKRLRRDAHEPSASCWAHGPTSCFSM